MISFREAFVESKHEGSLIFGFSESILSKLSSKTRNGLWKFKNGLDRQQTLPNERNKWNFFAMNLSFGEIYLFSPNGKLAAVFPETWQKFCFIFASWCSKVGVVFA